MQVPGMTSMMNLFDGKTADGGAKKAAAPKAKKAAVPKAKKPESTKPKRTAQKIVGPDGKPHTVYKKDGVSYFRRKSAKTGKMYYSRVTKA